MKRPRRISILQRQRIFVGCEGESERGYVALLGRLLEAQGPRVHLDAAVLGGGDPLAILETAERTIRQRLRRGEPYAARAVLLDADRQEIAPERTARGVALAAKLEMHLVWQDPCHEAMLLRHLDGCAQQRPPTTPLSLAALRRAWPDYEKGLPAARLAMRLDHPEVRRAANVEPALRVFLHMIGFELDDA